MLQDLRIEKEVLQALLAEMEKHGFVATTLHEIRTFAMEQQSMHTTVLCTCETIDTEITKLLDDACPVHGSHSGKIVGN